MSKILKTAAWVLLLAPSALAQITTVTGTVTDPNGIPYANGSISAQLIMTGTSPTLNRGSFSMSSVAGLDKNGKFTMRLADNTQIVPSTLKWQFVVCSAGGTVQPAGGTGPQCFTALFTISGATQDISATLNALAPALGTITGVPMGVAAGSQLVSHGVGQPHVDQAKPVLDARDFGIPSGTNA